MRINQWHKHDKTNQEWTSDDEQWVWCGWRLGFPF